MKPTSVRLEFFRPLIFSTTLLWAVGGSPAQAAETLVDGAIGNVAVDAGDTIWFDSNNTNVAIPLATINGSPPAVGLLPGWAHTRWSFMRYDGTSVSEVPAGEKLVGAGNLAAAGPNSVFDTGTGATVTTLTASKSIGLVETMRDFVINNGAVLDINLGGLMFHNDNHAVRSATGGGSVTSSSGQLVVVANGGGTGYQISNVTVTNASGTPVALVKTGPDPLALGAANTYSGGTWINNGRLQANHVSAFGAGSVLIAGPNAQAFLGASGNYSNAFEVEGNGPDEAGTRHGALRLGNGANLAGSIWMDGPTRVSVNNSGTATVSGALVGFDQLEIGTNIGSGLSGTLKITGDASNYSGTARVSSGGLAVDSFFGGSVIVGSGSVGGEGEIAGGLALDGAGRLTFDGSSPGTLDILGNVDLSGGTLSLVATAEAPGGGPVTAFTYGGNLVGNVANIVTDSLRNAVVTHDPVNKQVLVSYTFGSPEPLVWTGAASATWAADGAFNFVAGGSAEAFINGDDVIFDDSSTVKTVELGAVSPASVVFDHNENYQLSGGGGIMGSASLAKSGFGRLTLGGSSEFTGPVTIEAGTLAISSATALGFTTGVTIADGAQFDFNGQSTMLANRSYSFEIAGNGPTGNGALVSTAGNFPGEPAGVEHLTLTGDASVGGSVRFDLGLRSGTATLTGNGFTLTKVGSSDMGLRSIASGSPINFVIAAGRVWGENTDDAFGGTTGTLTVLGGAQASTYGVRNIATPVFLESGATLYNQGGGTGTWSGPIEITGSAIIGAGTTSPMVITGPITGSGSVIKSGTQDVTIASPGYEGNTTVSTGTLILGAATLADDSTVALSAGTRLTLNHAESDAIGTLVINGAVQVAGSYGSTASGADFQNDTYFSGTGRLVVSSSSGGGDLVWTGNVFPLWAADGELNFTSGGSPAAFAHGSNVTFDDSSDWKNLTMDLVIPGGTLFDHSEDYQVTGTGGISGSGTLTKRGSGRLTLGGQISDFTGQVQIEQGTLTLAHANALGNNSGITVGSGGQLDFAGLAPNRNYSFTIAGDGPDGMGALTNSATPGINQGAGVHLLTLSGDASVGGTQRFDLGRGGADSILTGNGHTLTKVGSNGMGFRSAVDGVTHFVIAGGSVWGENNDSSLGGTLGTVTVKSGARLGTYGPRIIPTPVFLEAGATLYNEGGALGTWTGPVNIQGNVTLFSSTSPVHITGPMSGTGNVTKTGAQPIVVAAPGYVGNTTVASGGGTLILGAPTLANSSTVSLAAGTRLELNYAGTDIVGSLVLDGAVQAAGTYGSSASSAANQNDTYFSGTGVLHVGAAGGGYDDWAAANGIAGTSPGMDSDGDGVKNGIEFVIGGNPNGGNSLPLLPTSSVDGTYLDFVFRRTSDSVAYSPRAEYGSNLGGWTPAQAGVNGVIVLVDPNHFGAGIDRVTVRIPRTLAAGGKFFARLAVNIP